MNILVLFLTAMAVFLFQSTLLQHLLPAFLLPDPTLLLVLFASITFPFGSGLAASFLIGLLADLLSGSPEGWNTLFALCIFLVNRSILARVFVKRSRSTLGLFLLDVALKLPCLLLVSTLSGIPLPSPEWMVILWSGECVSSLLLMPVLFRLLTEVLGIPKIQWLTLKSTGTR